MGRKRFSDMECPIAQALDEVGDWWTLLIVREAMYGTKGFDAFQTALGVARGVLSERLHRLVENDILIRTPDPADGRAYIYRLTAKGRALWPVIISLLQWSNDWIAPPGEELIQVRDRESGEALSHVGALSTSGKIVPLKSSTITAGPGASPALRQQISEIVRQQKKKR